MNHLESPEHYSSWIRSRFFNMNLDDLKNPSVLEGVKSWIKVGDEYYNDCRCWITLKSYIYFVCYVKGIDIIENCMSVKYAKEILLKLEGNPLIVLGLVKLPDTIQGLKAAFVESVENILNTYGEDDNDFFETVMTATFSAYIILLDKKIILDSFQNN